MRICAALALVVAGCSAPWSSSAAAIIDGTVTAADAATVGLAIRRAACDQTPGLLCTGVLISPRVVLTAAHCVAQLSGQGGIEVYFGGDVSADPQGQLMLATESSIDPTYDADTGADDLGLLRLPRDAPVAPVPLAAAPPPAGATVRIVGFGVVASGGDPDGRKRTGTMTIASSDARTLTLTPAPSNSCSGDSGGPVLAGPDGAEALAGVTVSGDPACATSAVAERIDGDAGAFLSGFVAASAAAAEVPSFGGEDFSRVCSAGCAGDSDCPGGLTCRPSSSGPSRCVLPGHLPGAIGEACQHDTDCGAQGSCARLDPDGCRCVRACPKGSGCALSASPPTPYPIVLVVVLAFFARRCIKIRRSSSAI